MSIKDDVNYIKNELSSEEKFLESFVKTERFFKKYKSQIKKQGSITIVDTQGEASGTVVTTVDTTKNKIEFTSDSLLIFFTSSSDTCKNAFSCFLSNCVWGFFVSDTFSPKTARAGWLVCSTGTGGSKLTSVRPPLPTAADLIGVAGSGLGLGLSTTGIRLLATAGGGPLDA